MSLVHLEKNVVLNAMTFLYPTESLRLMQVSKIFLRLIGMKKDTQEITSCDLLQALATKGMDLSPIYPQQTKRSTILGKMVSYPKVKKELVDFTIQWFEENAKQGHLGSQLALAVSYEHGHGVDTSKDKALEWYIKAARQGHAEAQFNVGQSYLCGEEVEQNYDQAFFWLEQAAIQGHTEAQLNVGQSCELGLGTDQNDEQAFYWYKKAARQGDVEAQHYLKRLL